MAFTGRERRIHKVFVTRNTEYHLKKDLCIAVRDRRSGRWLQAHMALRHRIQGGIRFARNGGLVPNLGSPRVGESLFFHAGGRDLLTSPVLCVERPTRDVVKAYPG